MIAGVLKMIELQSYINNHDKGENMIMCCLGKVWRQKTESNVLTSMCERRCLSEHNSWVNKI